MKMGGLPLPISWTSVQGDSQTSQVKNESVLPTCSTASRTSRGSRPSLSLVPSRTRQRSHGDGVSAVTASESNSLMLHAYKIEQNSRGQSPHIRYRCRSDGTVRGGVGVLWAVRGAGRTEVKFRPCRFSCFARGGALVRRRRASLVEAMERGRGAGRPFLCFASGTGPDPSLLRRRGSRILRAGRRCRSSGGLRPRSRRRGRPCCRRTAPWCAGR